MYRSGERIRHHGKLYAWFVGFVCLLGLGIFVITQSLRSDTQIGKAPAPTISTTGNPIAATTKFDEPLFAIVLPNDWKLKSVTNAPYAIYNFQSTLAHEDARWINVYVDGAPANLGVNKVLAVQAASNQLILESNVSDNCSSFTGATAAQPSDATPGKWQGNDFYCDLANYERDVVGTSSPEGPNEVTLTGTSGKHKFFFTYTDNNANPDYTIFTSALKTFQVK